MKGTWPFPGDSPVARARKMCGAYRQVAQQQHQAAEELRAAYLTQRKAAAALREAMEKADTRLLSYDSPATLELIKTALKELDTGQIPAAFDPTDPVADLDERFSSWGESFHAEQVEHYENDDYIKATVAATLIHVSAKTINTQRINGRIQGRWEEALGPSGGYLYKVADVYELSTKLHSRTWRKKQSLDTLNDSRRGDAECPPKDATVKAGPGTNSTPSTTASKTGSTAKPPQPHPENKKTPAVKHPVPAPDTKFVDLLRPSVPAGRDALAEVHRAALEDDHEAIAAAARKARQAQVSWSSIGRRIGISGEAARKRYRQPHPPDLP